MAQLVQLGWNICCSVFLYFSIPTLINLCPYEASQAVSSALPGFITFLTLGPGRQQCSEERAWAIPSSKLRIWDQLFFSAFFFMHWIWVISVKGLPHSNPSIKVGINMIVWCEAFGSSVADEEAAKFILWLAHNHKFLCDSQWVLSPLWLASNLQFQWVIGRVGKNWYKWTRLNV